MAAPMVHARTVLRFITLSAKSRIGVNQPKPVVGLFRQINRCLADDTSKTDEPPTKPEIELSHPKDRRKLDQTASSSDSSSSSEGSSDSGNDSDSSSSSDSDNELDSEVVSAVGDVAKALGGDTNKTASDLLSRLKSHEDLTAARREGQEEEGTDMSQLFEGMRVDLRQRRGAGQQQARGTDQRGRQGGRTAGRQRAGTDDQRDQFSGVLDQLQGQAGGRPTRQDQQRTRQRGGQEMNLKLFDGKNLGIFEKAAEIGAVTEIPSAPSLFDRLQREEVERQTTMPPDSAFDEQIRWAKQGVLWKFPIDNEQGMDEEAKVGFHEHVFLEPLIADFPKKGPLRHFMELVCVGLSKNPHVTVAEKREHIDWFRNYFAEKKHILDEVIVDPSSATQEIQPKAE